MQGDGAGTRIYSGKITGNHLIGTVTFGLTAAAPQFRWAGTLFSHPTGNPANGQHVYVACDDKVSVINTANHAVATVSLDAPGQRVTSLSVSADSSKAFVGMADPHGKALIFSIDGRGGASVRALPLKDSPIPSGVTSVALSADGSTLYAAGTDKTGTVPLIVALDADSGAVKESRKQPTAYFGNAVVFNPRLVFSGTSLLLDDATPTGFVAPPGPRIFGNDGHGLVAFPDGVRLCAATSSSPDHRIIIGAAIVTIATKAVIRKSGCAVVSPDNEKIYSNGQPLKSEVGSATSNPDFGAVVGAIWGNSNGITADGTTIFTSGGVGPTAYTIDTTTHLTTDAINVCEGPRVLGMAPLPGR